MQDEMFVLLYGKPPPLALKALLLLSSFCGDRSAAKPPLSSFAKRHKGETPNWDRTEAQSQSPNQLLHHALLPESDYRKFSSLDTLKETDKFLGFSYVSAPARA